MTALESTIGLTDPLSLHAKGRVLFDFIAFKKKGEIEAFSLHSPTGQIEHTSLVFALNQMLGQYSGLFEKDAMVCARVMDLGGFATVHLFERTEVQEHINVFELRASFQLGEVQEVTPKSARRESVLARMYREGRFD